MRLKRNTTLTGKSEWLSKSAMVTAMTMVITLNLWRGSFVLAYVAWLLYTLQPSPNIVNPKSRVTSGVRIPAPASPSPHPGHQREPHISCGPTIITTSADWERWATAFTVAIAGPRRKYIVQNVFPSSLIILFFCVLNSLWHKAGMRIVLWSDWPPIERPIVRVYL